MTGMKSSFIERMKIMGVYDAASKIMGEMLEAQGQPLENFEEEVIKGLRRFNLIKVEPV